MAIAGIDIGTTGSKISVYDESGAALFKSYRDYPASQYEGESDALSIWAAARDLLTEAARAVPGIRGVGVSSFGECFVPLDENDTPLMGVMPYTDPRGVEECAEFAAKLGAEHIADITGVMPHSMYSLPKLLWLKAHRPELLKKAKRVLLIEDYVVYMLTGVAQIDYSLATRTMFLDIRKLDWSD